MQYTAILFPSYYGPFKLSEMRVYCPFLVRRSNRIPEGYKRPKKRVKCNVFQAACYIVAK